MTAARDESLERAPGLKSKELRIEKVRPQRMWEKIGS
jgi:hypothetical protein